MKQFRIHIVLLLSFVFTVTGCSDDAPSTPETRIANLSVTLHGTLDIVGSVEVPESAILSLIWDVDGSPDYSYVYGRGTVDLENGTFTVTLDTPPRAALSQDPRGLYPSTGVGFIVLGDYASDDAHRLGVDELRKPIGVVNNTGVIYIDGDPAPYASHDHMTWPVYFPSGYSVGEGRQTTELHDRFVPARGEHLVMTISDDIRDFNLPNWK